MEANIFAADPPTPISPQGWGQLIKIQLFKNIGILYIKLHHQCSNMVANIFPRDPYFPRRLGQKFKIYFFRT